MSQETEPVEDEIFEDGDPICVKCRCNVSLRHDSEHDGYCDNCAHVELASLQSDVRRLVDFCRNTKVSAVNVTEYARILDAVESHLNPTTPA